MRPRRLRVGVPPAPTRLPSTNSVARIWNNVLPHLESRARIVLRDPGWRRGVDVWLCDGHQGPLDVREPVVAHLHEALWPEMPDRELLGEAFLATYAQPTADAAAAATRIITVSAASRDRLVEVYGLDASRVHVAHNGVDHECYRPGLPPPDEVLRAAGGDPGIPYVLYVSTLHPRKNLDVLREAVARLADDGRNLALVLVAGAAPDRPSSAELLAAAVAPIPRVATPVVNLAGASDETVAGLMGHAAALCQPSRMEGFGMAVAEAMACGTPVVVSNRGALPEVVGEAGLVVEPTPAALAAALATILDDPARAQDLRRRSIVRAARFTWEATADRWWEAIEAAVAGATA